MNIYIGNLADTTSESQLWDLFQTYGQINSVHIVTDRSTGRSMGFGFVDMHEREHALLAIEGLDAMNFMNHFIEVSEALSPESTRSFII